MDLPSSPVMSPPVSISKFRSRLAERIYEGPMRCVRLLGSKLLTRSEMVEDALARHFSSGWKAPPTLEELPDVISSLTSYAVLSHRWGPRELGISETQQLSEQRHHLNHPSTEKIIRFLAQAREAACKYAWFDSGCINQDSSAELDESIRSMFKWYRNATICIAYLGSTNSLEDIHRDEWFTRGWTLQELLAPGAVKFYGADWQELTSSELDIMRPHGGHIWTIAEGYEVDLPGASFEAIIAAAAGITISALRNFEPNVENAFEVISWMKSRQTTRSEDRAYSLLGLLDLHFPIAYGEGFERAFFRLQVEILQQTDNRATFLWSGEPSPRNSMLAPGPEAFDLSALSGGVPAASAPFIQGLTAKLAMPMTNRGICICMANIWGFHYTSEVDESLRAVKHVELEFVDGSMRSSWRWGIDHILVATYDSVVDTATSLLFYAYSQGACVRPKELKELKIGILGYGRHLPSGDDGYWCIFLEVVSQTPRRFKRLPLKPFHIKVVFDESKHIYYETQAAEIYIV